MKRLVFAVFIIAAVVSWTECRAEWEGRAMFGQQSRYQYDEPREVRGWLDDAVSSATPQRSESGLVTELETVYDFSFLKGRLGLGVFAKWLGSKTMKDVFGLPLVRYHDDQQVFRAGRFPSTLRGGGLLMGALPVAGVSYQNRIFHWEREAFAYGLLEPNVFDRNGIKVLGYRETVFLESGKMGALLVYDATEGFRDASRGESVPGLYASLYSDWEFSNAWYGQVEAAYGETSMALFGGLDIPLLSFLAWQTRVRYQDEAFAPLLGWYAREREKQTRVSIRLALDFFSEQLVFTPRFGVKHTPEQDYWLAGVGLECVFLDFLRIEALLASEQPRDAWGDLKHYEYTQLHAVWMIKEAFYLDYTYMKTFNGFLDWKEIQSRFGMEWQW